MCRCAVVQGVQVYSSTGCAGVLYYRVWRCTVLQGVHVYSSTECAGVHSCSTSTLGQGRRSCLSLSHRLSGEVQLAEDVDWLGGEF